MMSPDPDLVALFEDFFAREVTPEVTAQAERAGQFPAELWGRAAAVQIPWVGIAEEHGGVGGTLADAAAMLAEAAYRATPLPLLEHHVAAALLARSDVAVHDGPMTIAGLSQADRGAVVISSGVANGELRDVPWASQVERVVVLAVDDQGRDVAAVIDPADADITRGTALAGTPVDRIRLTDTPVRAGLIDGGAAEFIRYAEALRCACLAGMLRRLYDLTAGYVSERHQFGKPVGSFQAVQIHVVTLAQAATVAHVCVERVIGAIAAGFNADFEGDAASVVIGQHVVSAMAAAHQAHGAIGMTREYPLQQITRRLHDLRQVWEPLAVVTERVGARALRAPRVSELVARHPSEEQQEEAASL